jgi:hypothetical protein
MRVVKDHVCDFLGTNIIENAIKFPRGAKSSCSNEQLGQPDEGYLWERDDGPGGFEGAESISVDRYPRSNPVTITNLSDKPVTQRTLSGAVRDFPVSSELTNSHLNEAPQLSGSSSVDGAATGLISLKMGKFSGDSDVSGARVNNRNFMKKMIDSSDSEDNV